jgi:hypothetical protein
MADQTPIKTKPGTLPDFTLVPRQIDRSNG